MVLETGQASVSMLQRRLRLGYTRAARIIDAMEEEGIIGPFRGSKPREILIQEYQPKEETSIKEEPETATEETEQ
jgi:DNA segregation ATPase FtsK/SpoIIIE, S-DNA-T family